MIISKEHRYIFIAVPKTGTTSIQKLLLEHDPTAKNYAIEINGNSYSFGEHDTALQIKRELGELYSDFRTFGFIRNPYGRIVSSYHFYKNGVPITAGNKKPWPPRIRMAYAKLVPFKLWALSYPYKSNIEHFTDDEGNLIVDFIGTFENLKEDLSKIFALLELNIPTHRLKHTNKSDHSEYKAYFKDQFFTKVINWKIKNDLDFYKHHKFKL